MADETAAPTPIRGPLKYTVETSSPQLEAGHKFSVSVQITNPYDVTVTINDVITKLPAKFISPSLEPRPGRWKRLKEFAERESRETLGARAEGADLDSRFIRAKSQGPENVPSIMLQPGNSTVKVFGMLALGPRFFTPSTYNLNIEIVYDIDGKPNRDTVAFRMNVRAPMRAMIEGSMIGGLLGFLVRHGFESRFLSSLFCGSTAENAASSWPGLLTSILAAAMVVVAFARKKDSQPILSIEDFWGGLFVGFLTAYGGNALLQSVMGAR